MKILRNLLIILLISIVLLCGLIGLSAVRPDLFEGLMKKPEQQSELESIGEISPSQETVSPPSVSAPGIVSANKPSVSEDTVSGNITVSEDELPKAGLIQGISASYIPGKTELSVSPDLRSMTGYTEPHGTYDILDQNKADDIEKNLSTGPTGDDLTFDPEFFPYYQMLDDKGQHLYRQIYANAGELNPDFRAVEKDMPFASLKNVFEALFNDHPELFWLNTEYSARYREGGDCLELILSFNRTAKELEKSAKEFDDGANKIGSSLPEDKYEMEKAIHDAMCDSFSYDLSAEMNQSAYSGFANNSTVCAGYARAFQYIMMNLGIPCYYCRGMAGEPHAWNIIKLDDDYYNVDVTWDDSDKTWQYEYFNLSDDELSKDHRRTSLSVYLPACKGGKYGHLEQEPEDSDNGNHEDSGSRSGNREEERPAEEEPSQGSSGSKKAERPEGTYVNSLNEYYDICRQRIQEAGKGSYSFDIYTTDKNVYNDCMSAYTDGGAKNGYMNEIFASTEGAKGFSVDFTGSENDGVYKMTQKVRLY